MENGSLAIRTSRRRRHLEREKRRRQCERVFVVEEPAIFEALRHRANILFSISSSDYQPLAE